MIDFVSELAVIFFSFCLKISFGIDIRDAEVIAVRDN